MARRRSCAWRTRPTLSCPTSSPAPSTSGASTTKRSLSAIRASCMRLVPRSDQRGPSAELEGADLAGQAAGGLISTIGTDGSPMSPVGVTIADHIGSQNMTAGILAALFVRTKTGRGQTGRGFAAWRTDLRAGLRVHLHVDDRQRSWPLEFRPSTAADGIRDLANVGRLHRYCWVLPRNREQFFNLLGLPELIDDPRFLPPIMTTPVRLELFELIGAVTRTRTTKQWAADFREIGVRRAPVNNYTQAIADPDVVENGYVVEVDDGSGGARRVVGSPISMSETPLSPSATAPELGQDTEILLLELGYSWDEISNLRDQGAI